MDDFDHTSKWVSTLQTPKAPEDLASTRAGRGSGARERPMTLQLYSATNSAVKLTF